MVVENLKEEADGRDERRAVTVRVSFLERILDEDLPTYTATALSACMSFMASRNRPPVLLPTISR